MKNTLSCLKIACATLLLATSVPALAEDQAFHTQNYMVSCTGYQATHDRPAFLGCSVNGDAVNHSYKRDKQCELDWGSNFSLAKRGKANIDCASDTYASEGKILKTGQKIKGEGWTCTALANGGLRCLNLDRKGFVLQRNRQVLLD